MASQINPAFPAEGNASTASVRANTLITKNEIEALQTDKQDTLEAGTTIKTIAGKNPLGAGNLELTKDDVGLSNVNNTSDANKPVSNAQANAINLAAQNAVDMAVSEADTNAQALLDAALPLKQDLLESGENIKTFMQRSLLGAGDLDFPTLVDIQTPESSLRGVAHRGGWPNANTAGALLGASIWPVEAGSNYQLLFVGAVQNTEASARSGTFQADVEAPVGSGNWFVATFTTVRNGTFITSGATPDESNNWFMLLSDPIPVTFTEPQKLRVVVSGKGGCPTMTNYDGYYEGKPSQEFVIQSNSTLDASLQLGSIGPKIRNAILAAIESDGISMVPQVAISAVWAAGVLTLGLQSHGLTATNNKIVLSGFESSLAAIDGTYTYTTSGANLILIAMAADPGVISQFGIARNAQAVTAAVWGSGTLTFTRAAHGRLEGQVISVRGVSSTGATVDGDYPITAVTTDTYSVAAPSNPGVITFTNAYVFSKYLNTSVDYHLRPYSIIANGKVATIGLASDSTTQTVDKIQDNTLLCGVGQRCVGELFPFMDLSANNEGLSHWLANPAQVIIREKIISLYCQGLLMGYSKNDETAYALLVDWIAAHVAWWAKPAMAALIASKFNMAIKVASRSVFSRDNFSTVDGQLKPNNTRLLGFHGFLQSQLGVIYHKLFEYAALLTERNQPYAYKTTDAPQSILFTSTAGSPAIDVDPSTPINPSLNGKVIFLPGVGGSGANRYVRMRYVSPTKFISTQASIGIRIATANTTTVIGGTGVINPRRSIALDVAQADSLHENPEMIAEINKSSVGLKSISI